MIRNATVQDYFHSLPERFRASAAQGVDAVFQWVLSGTGAMQFHAAVKDGQLSVHEGAHAQPTVTLAATTENFMKVVNGEINGTLAVVTRKLKVSGSIAIAKKMQEIFPLENK